MQLGGRLDGTACSFQAKRLGGGSGHARRAMWLALSANDQIGACLSAVKKQTAPAIAGAAGF